MQIYSYVITRDYGFAPNPFYGVCTLATCKPKIRNKIGIGDWIIGLGSCARESSVKGKIVFVMKVNEKISFASYWQDTRFQQKKPMLNGSKKQMYGDNIYYQDEEGVFHQVNSHHSKADGSPNFDNQNRDLGGNYVVISNAFWYWGEKAVPIPDDFDWLKHITRGHSRITDQKQPILCSKFTNWINSIEKGYLGDPCRFSRQFERYNGRS